VLQRERGDCTRSQGMPTCERHHAEYTPYGRRPHMEPGV
jgi:hypothetical protein